MSSEMSTTKENVIWEERNLIEPKMKLENNGGSDVCGIITIIKESKENVPSIDTIKTKKKMSGIYKIINKINGKYYVGSAKNVRGRWAGHKYCLNKNIHKNPHLQSSWKKYGSDNFEFLLIKEVESNRLLIEEQKYLDIAKLEQDKCYNKSFLADRIEMTPQVIDKIRESNRRRIWSKESLVKLSKIHKGQKHTEETKQLLSQLLKGRKFSDETKLKIGKSMKGKLVGENNPMYGQKHTAETLNKMSESLKGRFSGDKHPFYGKRHTSDSVEKMKKSHEGRWVGNKNPMYGKTHSNESIEKMRLKLKDPTIFNFLNIKTKETFSGTKSDFIKKFKLHKSNIYSLINKKFKSCKGWILNEKAESVPTSQN